MEIVYLDTMSGFEFESLCERIFKKLRWGEIQKIGSVKMEVVIELFINQRVSIVRVQTPV